MRCFIFKFILNAINKRSQKKTANNNQNENCDYSSVLKAKFKRKNKNTHSKKTHKVNKHYPTADEMTAKRVTEKLFEQTDRKQPHFTVVNKLNQLGYEAYLVGGCVRDIVLNVTPKDFDVATNATPEEVKKTFRSCRLVGRRFRLAHVLFGRDVIEVATFRGEKNDPKNASQTLSENGMLVRDNNFGTLEQDAKRRDFTINALYYDVQQRAIYDFCNGVDDLKNGLIRLIGDPETRYREDPVRILRAIRFQAKLGMKIEPTTEMPMMKLVPLLNNIPGARLFDESLKLLQTGYGSKTFPLLVKYNVIQYLYPRLTELSKGIEFSEKSETHSNINTYAQRMIIKALANTDHRIKNGLRINSAFLYAAFLWYPLNEHTQTLISESDLSYHDAFNLAINDILSEQCKATSIPKRITAVVSDIWRLQLRLTRLTPKKAETTFEHIKFRAAFDLLLFRANIEQNKLLDLAHWWQLYQDTESEKRNELFNQIPQKYNVSGRKRYYRRKSTMA